MIQKNDPEKWPKKVIQKSDPKNDPKSDPKKWTAMPKSLGHGLNDPWVIGGGKKKNPAVYVSVASRQPIAPFSDALNIAKQYLWCPAQKKT